MAYVVMFDDEFSMELNGEINQFGYYENYPPKLKGSYKIFKEVKQ